MRASTTEVKTIDDYIRQFPGPLQAILNELRAAIRQTAPQASEKISYGMPTFFLNGNLVHFAAYEHHIGFYPTPAGITAFQDELKPYKSSKGAVQFPIDQPLPLDLIKKIVAYRVQANSRPNPPKDPPDRHRPTISPNPSFRP